MSKNREYILPVDSLVHNDHGDVMTEPMQGLFSVSFGKATLPRALGVFKAEGVWSVVLDGFLVAPPSREWREAFGWIRNDDGTLFMGVKISKSEYACLVRVRSGDRDNGLDLSARVDHQALPAPF